MSLKLNPYRWCGAAALGAAIALVLANAASAATAAGEWLSGEKTARIRIVDCAGALWGVVSWEADPGIDSYNPDPAKRGLPITGSAILRGLKPSGSNRWNGSLYNPDNGRTYSGGVTLLEADVLRVRGCILFILCGGESWTRVGEAGPPDTQTCARVAPVRSSR